MGCNKKIVFRSTNNSKVWHFYRSIVLWYGLAKAKNYPSKQQYSKHKVHMVRNISSIFRFIWQANKMYLPTKYTWAKILGMFFSFLYAIHNNETSQVLCYVVSSRQRKKSKSHYSFHLLSPYQNKICAKFTEFTHNFENEIHITSSRSTAYYRN